MSLVLDEWLAAIDRGDVLEIRDAYRRTVFSACRLAGCYLTKVNDVPWCAHADAEARSALKSRLAPFAESTDKHAAWKRNTSGAVDPFESTTHAIEFGFRGGSTYIERNADGSYLQSEVVEWDHDPMGGAWTEYRKTPLTSTAAKEAVVRYMRDGGSWFPRVILRQAVRRG